LTALEALENEHEKQCKWMIEGKIDDQEFKDFLMGIFIQEKNELFTSFYGASQKENELLGINDVRLQIKDQMIGGNFIHNDAYLLIGNPPYKEEEYLLI